MQNLSTDDEYREIEKKALAEMDELEGMFRSFEYAMLSCWSAKDKLKDDIRRRPLSTYSKEELIVELAKRGVHINESGTTKANS